MSTPRKSYLDLISACDRLPYGDLPTSLYVLLLPNDTRPHGYMLPETVKNMPWTSDFRIIHSPPTVQLLDSSNGQDTEKVCNAAFDKVVTACIDQDIFEMVHKRHSEHYALIGANHALRLERFSHALWGIAARGVHMTAYVRTPDGFRIWVPRRSAHLFTYPGKLDSTVAGGAKASDSPLDCMLAEAFEEASLPPELVRQRLHPAGTLTYVTLFSSPGGRERDLISPEVLYVYDMELPPDVILKPQDDEVQEFRLMDVEQVKEALFREEFKTNSAVVMIDFFVRHGIITPEDEPDYIEIVSRMHRSLPVATTPTTR